MPAMANLLPSRDFVEVSEDKRVVCHNVIGELPAMNQKGFLGYGIAKAHGYHNGSMAEHWGRHCT